MTFVKNWTITQDRILLRDRIRAVWPTADVSTHTSTQQSNSILNAIVDAIDEDGERLVEIGKKLDAVIALFDLSAQVQTLTTLNATSAQDALKTMLALQEQLIAAGWKIERSAASKAAK